jgi:hypothetical protein
VATSRLAGLRYFEILQEKLRERGAGFKVLYAFSDFVHPVTGTTVTEYALNGLGAGELIEDRFEGDDMPSETEFVQRIGRDKKPKVPQLEATEEQLAKFPAPNDADAPASTEAPRAEPRPAGSYPPLEPQR